MEIARLDHVAVRTADVDRLAAWYRDVLGLEAGPRPDFDFPGAWLYAGERAVIHLIGVDARPGADPADLRLEHLSLHAGTGLAGFLDRLRDKGVAWRASRLPGAGWGQVLINIADADGNHLHVDFDAAEADGVDL